MNTEMTLPQRCKVATDCLPDAPYRTQLTALHDELLANLDAVKSALARFLDQDYMRRPLTEDQIAEISVACAVVTPSDIYFARRIERAHGIGGKP